MIPDFNIHGVVPPIRPGELGHSDDRAPYPTDMLTFCQRFGSTADRCAILGGLLDLRHALRGAGLADGFQWIDGSFTEDVESIRRRPPADIDVVTFAALGDAAAQRALAARYPTLLNRAHIKATWRVDHYYMQTDPGSIDEGFARRVSYWYSMWAHQRDTDRWKGFVSVRLQSTDDLARGWLSKQTGNGVAP
jgi:hypothetical protein